MADEASTGSGGFKILGVLYSIAVRIAQWLDPPPPLPPPLQQIQNVTYTFQNCGDILFNPQDATIEAAKTSTTDAAEKPNPPAPRKRYRTRKRY